VFENESFQISAGAGHTCGITTKLDLMCWGDNLHGQSKVPEGHSSRINRVAAGGLHTCGINIYG
jgi:alpha-tubulin suppressor-like RCC1 family protein